MQWCDGNSDTNNKKVYYMVYIYIYPLYHYVGICCTV